MFNNRMAWRRLVVSTAVCAALQTTVAVGSASANPPNTDSYYVAPGDTNSTAQTLGCNQAKLDVNAANPTTVTLDFGAQNSAGTGTYLVGTSVLWSNQTDLAYAEWFAYGADSCWTSGNYNDLVFINMGTNNDGSLINGSLGAVWGSLVLAGYNYDVNDIAASLIDGAIDAEPGYSMNGSTVAGALGWARGDSTGVGYFASSQDGGLVDFGSADGCPTSYIVLRKVDHTCENGWTYSDLYDLAWYWGPGFIGPQPEIYYSDQAVQWADITAYGNAVDTDPIEFAASLSENGYGGTLTADQSYDDLSTDVDHMVPSSLPITIESTITTQ